jgi:hypothetical protein
MIIKNIGEQDFTFCIPEFSKSQVTLIPGDTLEKMHIKFLPFLKDNKSYIAIGWENKEERDQLLEENLFFYNIQDLK